MTYQEFIKPIIELAEKYGWQKETSTNNGTDMYSIYTGKTRSLFYFYPGDLNRGNCLVWGRARGLQEYVGVKGNHLVSKCDEDISLVSYDEFNIELFENWIKNQTEVVARHDKYLKDKEIKRNEKKANQDF